MRHFLAGAASAYGRGPLGISEEAIAWLQRQPWPGNVRQLKHAVERAVLLGGGVPLGVEPMRRALEMDGEEPARDQLPAVGSMTMDEIEKFMILKSLEHHRGNLSRVAESLGLSRAALYRRLERYGIRT